MFAVPVSTVSPQFPFSVLRSIFLLVLCTVCAHSELIYSVTTLGGFSNTSRAFAVNDHGQVAGQGGDGGFFWDSATGLQFIDLGSVPMSDVGRAHDLNNAGQVVGMMYIRYGSDSSGTEAFIWNAANGARLLIQDPGDLPHRMQSQAYGINDLGQVVGFSYGAGITSGAFLWDETNGLSFAPITDEFGTERAKDINNAGQIVSWGYAGNDWHASLWNGDTSSVLIDLGTIREGEWSRPEAINSNGAVVGASYFPLLDGQAFLWQAETGMVGLGLLQGASSSVAYGINDSNQVVGVSGVERAFYWDSTNGMLELSTLIAEAGWIITDAQDINSSGQIAATGYNPLLGITSQALLLTPMNTNEVPEPSTALLILGGGALLLFFRKRARN